MAVVGERVIETTRTMISKEIRNNKKKGRSRIKMVIARVVLCSLCFKGEKRGNTCNFIEMEFLTRGFSFQRRRRSAASGSKIPLYLSSR